MVDSKINAKKYFLPLYLTWAIVTPLIVSYIAGYIGAEEGQSAFDAIPWGRVPSFFALFGFIWPLTLVISPAFFASLKIETGLTFLETIGTDWSAFWAYILISIAWIGPLVSSVIVIYLHKEDVSKQINDPKDFGWIDYLAAFV